MPRRTDTPEPPPSKPAPRSERSIQVAKQARRSNGRFASKAALARARRATAAAAAAAAKATTAEAVALAAGTATPAPDFPATPPTDEAADPEPMQMSEPMHTSELTHVSAPLDAPAPATVDMPTAPAPALTSPIGPPPQDLPQDLSSGGWPASSTASGPTSTVLASTSTLSLPLTLQPPDGSEGAGLGPTSAPQGITVADIQATAAWDSFYRSRGTRATRSLPLPQAQAAHGDASAAPTPEAAQALLGTPGGRLVWLTTLPRQASKLFETS